MGMMDGLLGMVFGSGGTALRETAEVFRENAEAGAAREASQRAAALAQFAQEFARAPVSRFDRLVDSLNRLPRPALAFGTLALLVSAMTSPEWFAARMTGLALVPEPLWWLLGAVVSFYFGARHQTKGQDFQRQLAAAFAQGSRLAVETAETAQTSPATRDGNAALDEWRSRLG
ncbi:holin family protein [Salipiger mangrovisoli]|uniref:Holin family protein n=1 Tax=Salipiger mangrovisoli TaxID=2865933 RepID=A0ABR9X3C9_9RHOB|nr:holin family protein [Salipiger mangrovisoli]MBE9638080.1 holin family protein [Salipiger mangrovisoli]